MRAIAQRILEKHGHRVLVADTVTDAVRLSETHQGKIDLLLTDVVMAGATGPQLARLLLVQRPDLRVMYMSGYTDGTVVSEGVLEGNPSFLQKPFSGELLVRKVRTALDEPRP